MDDHFIVGAKQNMPLAPHVAPNMSGNDNWEELLISNRLLLLRRSPRTRKPVALQPCLYRNNLCQNGFVSKRPVTMCHGIPVPLLACHALQFLLRYNKIDPSVVLSAFDWDQFSEIHQHSWKEHLTISENAKFEGYLLKTETCNLEVYNSVPVLGFWRTNQDLVPSMESLLCIALVWWKLCKAM